MSMLRHITTRVCPDCKCTIINKEEVNVRRLEDGVTIPTHKVSGKRIERRFFACGYTVEFHPLDDKEKVIDICLYHPRIKKINDARQQAITDVFWFIQKLKVDGIFKKHLGNCIEGQDRIAKFPKEAIIEGYLESYLEGDEPDVDIETRSNK